jgi:hypothetical protein
MLALGGTFLPLSHFNFINSLKHCFVIIIGTDDVSNFKAAKEAWMRFSYWKISIGLVVWSHAFGKCTSQAPRTKSILGPRIHPQHAWFDTSNEVS